MQHLCNWSANLKLFYERKLTLPAQLKTRFYQKLWLTVECGNWCYPGNFNCASCSKFYKRLLLFFDFFQIIGLPANETIRTLNPFSVLLAGVRSRAEVSSTISRSHHPSPHQGWLGVQVDEIRAPPLSQVSSQLDKLHLPNCPQAYVFQLCRHHPAAPKFCATLYWIHGPERNWPAERLRQCDVVAYNAWPRWSRRQSRWWQLLSQLSVLKGLKCLSRSDPWQFPHVSCFV